jgi:hypothetical protein
MIGSWQTFRAVQGEVPMTAQGESAAFPPPGRPEARRPPVFVLQSLSCAFFLAKNTSAGGFRRHRLHSAGVMR